MASSCSCSTPNHRSRSELGKPSTNWNGINPVSAQRSTTALRQALYRWVRVYDDWDARNRIEQMTEWAEGEDDPDSYEIPKLEQDLPECLKAQTATDSLPPLASFPTLE